MLLFVEISYGQERPVHVSVVDAEGVPIPNTSVNIEYRLEGTTNTEIIKAQTNSNGSVDATALNIKVVGIGASKNGYYSTWVSGKSRKSDQIYNIAMTKVMNPVPLYARTVSLEYPDIQNGKVGFDFFEGDWVAPHGKGVVADLSMTVVPGESIDKSLNLSTSQHLHVSFPNPGDGIHPYPLNHQPQESDFQFPYSAPSMGYSRELYFEVSGMPRLQPGITPPPVYPFAFARIRSQPDGLNESYSGYYLKLYPSIQASHPFLLFRKVTMTYYLNSTFNNRNLEFNPERNLYDNVVANSEVLDNLNLMKKEPFQRDVLSSKRTMSFHQKAHYMTVEEIKEKELADKMLKSAPSKVVFTTDEAWTGNLGGIEGANEKCQREADKNSTLVGRKFSAWIANWGASPPTENSGFLKSGIRYATVDGKTVGKNYTDLVRDGNYALIGMTASGSIISETSIWTNVTAGGGIDSTLNHCRSWSSASPTDRGQFGVLSFPLRNNCKAFKLDCASWTTASRNSLTVPAKNKNGVSKGCSAMRRLYCFEQ